MPGGHDGGSWTWTSPLVTLATCGHRSAVNTSCPVKETASLPLSNMATNVVLDLVILHGGPATWPVTEISIDPQIRIHAFGRWTAGNAHRYSSLKVRRE